MGQHNMLALVINVVVLKVFLGEGKEGCIDADIIIGFGQDEGVDNPPGIALIDGQDECWVIAGNGELFDVVIGGDLIPTGGQFEGIGDMIGLAMIQGKIILFEFRSHLSNPLSR